MSVRYHCPHLEAPRAPLPPVYPSSSSSLHPLPSLYFCEECDAVRCDQCVAIEVASYFCPNCLFDVPSANVRGDKNRCARNCFSCPQCTSPLMVQATETFPSGRGSSSAPTAGPPYLLACPSCKWSSKEIGWAFEKPTSLALQLPRINKETEAVQHEFDALKDHLESYIASSLAATFVKPAVAHRNPSRHISHLTQMAAKALQREVPGMTVKPARTQSKVGLEREGKEKYGWDELEVYEAKQSWKMLGMQRGFGDVHGIPELTQTGVGGIAPLDRRWCGSWDADRTARTIVPERIQLQTKLTKRCPHPNCRHLLIQPDTKSVRMKIKMVAMSYLPVIELGRRRRKKSMEDLGDVAIAEEAEKRRRERRRTRAAALDDDQDLDQALTPGDRYNFQLAFTNPLFDPIQIRLTQPHRPKSGPSPNNRIHISTPHFLVDPVKDAWAYDEDEVDDITLGMDSSEGASEEAGSLSKRSRLSVLDLGSMRDKKSRNGGVEKKGNITKVGLDVEVLPEASGPVEFDLEVRYTYRAEEALPHSEKTGRSTEKPAKEDYKTFTFWIRLNVGGVEASPTE